jgi:hypothetical protein
LGIVYNWITGDVWSAMIGNTIASVWESNLAIIENNMQTSINAFANMD